MRYLVPPLAILATVAMLFGSVAPASACSCIPISEDTDPAVYYLNNAVTVVYGTVDELVPAPGRESPRDVSAIVSVERYLKGQGPAVIEVHDPPDGAACGYFHGARDALVLFLTKRGGDFYTHLCAGNGLPLAQVEAVTGPGEPPLEQTAEATPSPVPESETPADQTSTDGDSEPAALSPEAESDELPAVPVWAAAILLPVVFLVGAALWPWIKGRGS